MLILPVCLEPIAPVFFTLRCVHEEGKGPYWVLGILQSSEGERHAGRSPFILDLAVHLGLFVHVFLTRPASTHWASPRSVSSSCEHKGLLYCTQWEPRSVGPLPHSIPRSYNRSGSSPFTIAKISSGPEKSWVPPTSGPCQACVLLWLMAKIVLTDAHYHYVIIGGERKLLTSDYSTCEYLCGISVKVTSATLLKSSSVFVSLWFLQHPSVRSACKVNSLCMRMQMEYS